MIQGTNHFPGEHDQLYSRIFAGVAWPAVRPGFVAVVGEHKIERVGGLPKLVVLDEARDHRLWHVVERAAALWFYYAPERVLTDREHVAAMQFAEEYRPRGFAMDHSLLCAMDGPFGYAFPVLDRMMQMGRLEVPKTSLLQGELLTGPANEDLAKLRLSDFPAIAALAFAVLELDRTRETPGMVRQMEAARPGRILR